MRSSQNTKDLTTLPRLNSSRIETLANDVYHLRQEIRQIQSIVHVALWLSFMVAVVGIFVVFVGIVW